MTDGKLVISPNLTYHEQHGAYYVYHNLVGYLLKMSHDVLGYLEAFREPMTVDEAVAHFEGRYPADMVKDFAQTFRNHLCLLGPEDKENEAIWSMFPVRGRWLVYHAPKDPNAAIRFVRVDENGTEHVEEAAGWRRAFWEMLDGDKTFSALLAMLHRHDDFPRGKEGERALLETVRRWVGVEMQLLRLSEYPQSMYKAQPHLHQPYLTSVMPFPRFTWGEPPKPALEDLREVTPTRYYKTDVADADKQFEEVETTLSHLFREPHPVLHGRTYGACLAHELQKRGNLPEKTKQIVEVGGGLGFFAKAFLGELLDASPELADELRYRIVDVCPTLQDAQKERLGPHADRIEFVQGDAETHEFESNSVSLLLCNEVVGDLRAIKVGRNELGLGFDQEAAMQKSGPSGLYDGLEEKVRSVGEAGEAILKYQLPLQDAPGEFFVAVGFYKFLEQVYDALEPGGAAVITEFGEEHQYPQLSTHLDHPELSIHWGHAMHVARRIGFDAEFTYVIDLLDFDRDQKTLATTGGSFVALRKLLADFGVDLKKLAYTEDMLRELCGDKVNIDEVFELKFDRVEDRCMGLVPHQFKALVLRKPAQQSWDIEV